MDLEKLVKSSFDQFEPEVNPSVWQRLEQNLNAPQGPADPSGTASVAGKTALKTILGNTSPWIWFTGIVSTAAIITAIVATSPKATDVPAPQAPGSIENVSSGPAVENPNAQVTENSSAPTDEMGETKKLTEEKGNIQLEEKMADNVLEKESMQPAKEMPVSTDKPATGFPTTNIQPSPSINVKPNDQVSEKPAAVQPSPVNSQLPTAPVEPVVIINTQTGFAPLKVVALLNQEQADGKWDFGDGQADLSATTISHTYSNPGTYKLVCTVGEKSIEKTIEVIGTVSTAFTPNGDGRNDEFYVETSLLQLQELSVKIMDRTGKMVFEITQPGQHWDGKDNSGENVPSGTYFYNIFARSANGQINQKGTISIFR